MGDRARLVFVHGEELSPIVYLHNGGSDVPDYLAKLATMMAARKGDPSYAAARFIGIVHEHTPPPYSLGVDNCPAWLAEAIALDLSELIASASHGDAGFLIVDCADFSWRAFGGYLADAPVLRNRR
jgi:hypothetical protein